MLQVNLCQKLLFLHQLIHNMMTDCSLHYKFNAFRTIFVHNMFSSCSAKRRASDKDLPVCARERQLLKINLTKFIDLILTSILSALA